MSQSVQAVLLLPLAVGLLLGALQWGLVAWAHATAAAAVDEGLRETALHGGTEQAGRQAALKVTNNGALSEVTTGVQLAGDQAHVVVKGQAVSLLWPVMVERSGSRPVESVS